MHFNFFARDLIFIEGKIGSIRTWLESGQNQSIKAFPKKRIWISRGDLQKKDYEIYIIGVIELQAQLTSRGACKDGIAEEIL